MRVARFAYLPLLVASIAAAQTPLDPVWRHLVGAGGYGFDLAGIGDTDGDGFAEFVVGEPFISPSAAEQYGLVWGYRGSPSGPGEVADFGYQDPTNFNDLGYSVAGAGDVNGDGFADLVVGTGIWKVYGYYGSASGLPSTPNWTVSTKSAGGGAEAVVRAAGDVNGDGFDDVVVGTEYCARGQSREGCAFLYLGSAQGLATTPAWIAESDQVNAYFGRGIAGAGDVNGDGYDDVVVGAPGFDGGEFDEGRAYLYLGSASGLASTAIATFEMDQAGADLGRAVTGVGDIDGDAFDDVLIAAPRYDGVGYNSGRVVILPGASSGWGTTPNWTAEGSVPDELFGESAAAIGDFDLDGRGDLAIGAPRAGGGSPGNVFVYRGIPQGLATTPAYVATALSVGCFGCAVAGAGDLDGDGFPELAVGDQSLSQAFLYSLHTRAATSASDGPFDVPLTVALASDGFELHLDWGDACGPEDDYNIYEGTLGDFASHAPFSCGSFHTREFFLRAPAGSTYYLVVPRRLGREGSYGRLSSGAERPASADACTPQAIETCP